MLVTAAVVALLAAPSVATPAAWPTRDWPTVSPASVGLDARTLADFDAAIARGEFGYVDSMLVIRHGKVAYERTYDHDYAAYAGQVPEPGALSLHDPSGPYNYLNPWWHPFYRRGVLHTMQSITKTVMSVTIGAALARGEFPALDTPILRFLDEGKTGNVDDRKRRVTIRHLLTMTSGIQWREDVAFSDPQNSAHAMEASFDWAQYTVDQPMQHEPGQVFHYSSGSSQLLARVFQRATGHDLEEYAATRVFAPLGIDQFYWKRTPTGEANAEGGLYLRPRDLAKIGYLFLKDGTWEGKPIVTREWVTASVTPAATASESTGTKYGYQWWLLPHGDGSGLAWSAWGWGGQYLMVVPESDLVLVFTGWNIVPGKPGLRPSVALERVLRALRRP